MQVKAAVAFAPGEPLVIEQVELDGPREGEVLVEIKATGVCHTDAYTLSGQDPEGIFPSILGHEGAGIVVDIGKGVTSLKPGDHVIPLYTPECRQCEYCLSRKTNLCQAIRTTQGKGLMPNGTSRFALTVHPSIIIWVHPRLPIILLYLKLPWQKYARTLPLRKLLHRLWCHYWYWCSN